MIWPVRISIHFGKKYHSQFENVWWLQWPVVWSGTTNKKKKSPAESLERQEWQQKAKICNKIWVDVQHSFGSLVWLCGAGWAGPGLKNWIPNPSGVGCRSVAEAVNNGFNLKLPYENITGSELAEMDFFRNPLLRKSSKRVQFQSGRMCFRCFPGYKTKA